ncbi:type IV secretory system conjugative DNA transfer family protein [Candidatus Berkelbacteria bacterium]|nr:type IV secretory system conjugative DNA transfer family protein [Candidatus Berkelbacteria bacterium]
MTPILLLVTIGLTVVVGLRWHTRLLDRRALTSASDLVALKVLVPREPDKQEAEESRGRDFRETMSVAEQFLASFASLYEPDVTHQLLGQETLSFEIVAKDNVIHFFIVVPKRLQQLVERQLQSYYPAAQIETSQEFKMFADPLYVAGALMTLAKPYQYPIRTYKNLESDPLNVITNSLSKLPEGVRAGLQVLIQPTSGRWREKTSSAASLIAQGKSAKAHWVLEGLTNVLGAARGQGSESKPAEPVRLTPIQEEMMKLIREKGSKVGFNTQVRLIVASPTSVPESQMIIDNLASAFSQYTSPELNHLKRTRVTNVTEFVADYILRRFRSSASRILNTEEIASIYHIPNHHIDTPTIAWLAARTLAPPSNLPSADSTSVVIGKSVFRGAEQLVRLKLDDRRRHLYAVGKTGVGKTTIFIHQIVQDIAAGRGVAYLDPNGDAIEEILGLIPKERAEDVILFDPSDLDRPMGLNMLEWHRPEDRDFLVAEWLLIFQKLFDPNQQGMVGPQFEHWGRNASLTVMARPEGGTLIDIPRLFTDDTFRDDSLRHVTDPVVRAFWEQQMAKTADFHKSEMYNYFISKFGRFMTNDLMRNVIGQTKSAFDFRSVMDDKKILLVNLSKGKIGETNSYLLGMIIVAKLQVGAFQRADTPEVDRQDFYLYVDEFQNFTTDNFKTILAEARKYRLNLAITNQYIAQLPDDIRDAVIGNAGTIVSFRVGAADAEFLAKEFPSVTEHDLTNLPARTTYVKLLIDGTPSKPFSMQTIKTTVPFHAELAAAIRQLSRLKFGKDRRFVEQELLSRVIDPPPSKPIPDFPPIREA